MPLITMIHSRIGKFNAAATAVPAGMVIRSCTRGDIPALGVACASVEEAEDDIRASFDGEYGKLWLRASPVILHENQIIAALKTVRRASWDGTPDGLLTPSSF